MAGRTPSIAFNNYLEPVQEAVGCITEVPLVTRTRRRFTVGELYAVSLNRNDPVNLRGGIPVALTAFQVVRIVRVEREDDPRGPYKISTVEYGYEISTPSRNELLSFHWTPEGEATGTRTFPHMHVGRELLGGQESIRPGEFHKVHVPTGRVSIEGIIRLLIEDFKVTPIKPNWDDLLLSTETAFQKWRTR